MKCGHCRAEIVTNGNALPTLKVERVLLRGEGHWPERSWVIVCPFCDSIISFFETERHGQAA